MTNLNMTAFDINAKALAYTGMYFALKETLFSPSGTTRQLAQTNFKQSREIKKAPYSPWERDRDTF